MVLTSSHPLKCSFIDFCPNIVSLPPKIGWETEAQRHWGSQDAKSRCEHSLHPDLLAALSHGTAKGFPAVWALGYSCTSIVSCWRSTGAILIPWLCLVTCSVLHTFNNSCWLHPVMVSVHSRINFGPNESSVILKSCVGLCLGCPGVNTWPGNLSSPKTI